MVSVASYPHAGHVSVDQSSTASGPLLCTIFTISYRIRQSVLPTILNSARGSSRLRPPKAAPLLRAPTERSDMPAGHWKRHDGRRQTRSPYPAGELPANGTLPRTAPVLSTSTATRRQGQPRQAKAVARSRLKRLSPRVAHPRPTVPSASYCSKEVALAPARRLWTKWARGENGRTEG
jgi:hypothetical protein